MLSSRTRRLAFAGLLALSCFGFAAASLAQSAGRSVLDGVYTAEQAARGGAVYAARCAACHGPSLGGVDSAPPLSGPAFLSNWHGTSAADLFSRIHDTMPVDNPGSLSNSQTAEIQAYIMQANGFPAGSTPLASNPTMLRGTRIIAQRPGR
jgi:quinoprotein glucose dehydrogenase